LEDNVFFTDFKKREHVMDETNLKDIIDNIKHLPDGRIRAVASKYISGVPISSFEFKGTRKNDPNDFIPHEHRRELRGLRIIAAWLNHSDAKAVNTFDTYITESSRSYVKHYLLDFGSTLGSAAYGPSPLRKGYANKFDPHFIFTNLITLGLYTPKWQKVSYDIQYPSIGRINFEFFHSLQYKFIVPNQTFEYMTNLDGYWKAKIVMSFTDEQLEASITQADYSDQEAADYLLQNLIERRNITNRYWFRRVNPLDKFELRKNSAGKQELCFVDLTVEYGLEQIEQSQYRYDLKHDRKLISESNNLSNKTCILLDSSANDTELQIALQTKRSGNSK